jgi:hypothetical protein
MKKKIIKLLIIFLKFFASFPCTLNQNCIPNMVPVPVLESPNEYGSDRFWFRLRNADFQNKISRTGQAGRDRQEGTGRKGQAGWDRQDGIGRKGQAGRDRQNWLVRTGL